MRKHMANNIGYEMKCKKNGIRIVHQENGLTNKNSDNPLPTIPP